jgi:hypothetical protein
MIPPDALPYWAIKEQLIAEHERQRAAAWDRHTDLFRGVEHRWNTACSNERYEADVSRLDDQLQAQLRRHRRI